MLVEDEAIIAMHEKQQLQELGYKVHHILEGEDAVELIKKSEFTIDIILMDIDLGAGLDGTQAAEFILKERDVPIIFLSSHTEPEIVKKNRENNILRICCEKTQESLSLILQLKWHSGYLMQTGM